MNNINHPANLVSRLDMNGNNDHPAEVVRWIKEISSQIRLAIKGQIIATLYPYRFQGIEYLAFDLEGAQGGFSLTFMAGQPTELNDITPCVTDMSQALALAAALIFSVDALVKFSRALKADDYEII